MYRIAPDVTIIDISHNVSAHSIFEGALKLRSAYRHFPTDTIHVAVVDPGVGSERRILLARTGEYFFLAPDNGLLTFVFDVSPPLELISVENSRFFLPGAATTFHGRDKFAPVAAHLAKGVSPESFGPPAAEITKLEHPCLAIEEHRIIGEIIYIDKFGNLISSIPHQMLEGKHIKKILFREYSIKALSPSYYRGRKGECMALVNSFDNLEIAVNQQSARDVLKGEIHDTVVVEFEEYTGAGT